MRQQKWRMPFCLPSTWMPSKGRDMALEAYLRKLEWKSKTKLRTCRRRPRSNLSPPEGYIAIKPADKGSSVVVLSRQDYILKAGQQLNDTNYYLKLNADPTLAYAEEIKEHSMSCSPKVPSTKVRRISWFLTPRKQPGFTSPLNTINPVSLVEP